MKKDIYKSVTTENLKKRINRKMEIEKKHGKQSHHINQHDDGTGIIVYAAVGGHTTNTYNNDTTMVDQANHSNSGINPEGSTGGIGELTDKIGDYLSNNLIVKTVTDNLKESGAGAAGTAVVGATAVSGVASGAVQIVDPTKVAGGIVSNTVKNTFDPINMLME